MSNANQIAEQADRLRAARVAAGFMSAKEAVDRFGWKFSTYAAHENGQNGYAKSAARYAAAFGTTVGRLLNGEEEVRGELSRMKGDLVPARVAGNVAAGHFLEVDELVAHETVFIQVPRDEQFPQARMMAFDVAGDSMNALTPFPILSGARIICVDFSDLDGRLPLRDGMIVVLERARDGGQLREWSVKQLELHDDHYEFHPRSTNAKHKPIRVDRNLQADDGVTVEILAVVRQILNAVPL